MGGREGGNHTCVEEPVCTAAGRGLHQLRDGEREFLQEQDTTKI